MIKYEKTKWDFNTEGPSLTEQEHKDSCDINKMILNAHRGLQVRGGPQPQYGFDDVNLDPIQFRIQKEELENELSATAQQNEFSPDELKHIHPDVQKKFGFKAKKSKPDQPSKQNDQTIKNQGDPGSQNPDPSSTAPAVSNSSSPTPKS